MCKFRNVTLKFRGSPKMKRRSLPTVTEESPNKLYKSDFAVYCMVTTTAVLSYVNSLNGEFLHDDIPAIVTNPDVIGTNSLKHLLLNDFWGTPMYDVNSHKSYRPLTTLTFRINHWLCGKRVWWWHAVNVALHAACCALVVGVARAARLRPPFAALAALMFAAHPVHTEAVAGVVGRADVLACVFLLASLLVYHRPTGSKHCVWLSVALGALSMLAKETGITVLLLNLSFDLYRCWPCVKRSIGGVRLERRCSSLSTRALKVLLSLALLVGARLALLQGSMPTFSPQDNPAAFHPSRVVRLLTFCYLVALNWWLVLCPWSLSHDWQLGSVPLVTSLWDPRNLLTAVALGGLLLLGYKCLSDFEEQRQSPLVLGLLLQTVPFVPAANLLVTVGFVIAERILYIPSVGSVIITAYGVQLMWYSKPGAKFLLVAGLAILLASGVARTQRRNADWRDRGTLLRADLGSLPHNAKLHYNFGNFLRESDQHVDAINHYKEALRLWPSYASAHNNLGTLVSGTNAAEHHFLQAIRHNKYHVNAHFNLGKLYKKNGRFSDALSMLERCLWLDPRFIQAHLELMTLKPILKQKELLARLLELEPDNWEHYVLYGNWWRDRGISSIAARYYLEATRLALRGRYEDKAFRADLVSLRKTSLAFRALGQRSLVLQLTTRWHTWRRGRPSAAVHLYWRDWRLRIELETRTKVYSKAFNPSKSTKCFNHKQLEINENQLIEERTLLVSKDHYHSKFKFVKPTNSEKNLINNQKLCNCNSCEIKKRISVSTQIKTTHNKSEAGLKQKHCNCKNKEKKKNEVMRKLSSSLADYSILIKTF